MEYLPFGELLVDEHQNSYNTPFKFNAKELDEETGWYYYGARYYDPKWSVWLSVDKKYALYHDYSPYNYTLQNPINLTDPDGNSPFGDYFSSRGIYLGSDGIDDRKVYISAGSRNNFLSASKQEVPGGIRSLGAIKTSLALTNAPSNHKLSPDTKGGMHEVRVDIGPNETKYTTGGKVSIDNNGIATGSVNFMDIGNYDTSNTEILGHSHPTATFIENGKVFTFLAEETTQEDRDSFKNYEINFVSGNLERKSVTQNPDGSYNMPNNKQGGIFFNRKGEEVLRLESRVINNILSNYENGKIKE